MYRAFHSPYLYALKVFWLFYWAYIVCYISESVFKPCKALYALVVYTVKYAQAKLAVADTPCLFSCVEHEWKVKNKELVGKA